MPPQHGGIGITGLGKCLPKNRVASSKLAERLDVSAEWIVKSSGIESRYFADPDESVSLLSCGAAKQALKRARLSPRDIDGIIVCTFSGDYIFPAVACKIQHMLKAGRASAFDLSAGSVGFQFGINVAHDRLTCDPELSHVLVIGTAVQSCYLDWSRPEVAILFGDGSGAAVVSKVPQKYGILARHFFSKGEAYDAVRLRSGGSSHPIRPDRADCKPQFIEMDGMRVGREYLKNQPIVVKQVLKKANLLLSDVDRFIFHQANLRLIQFLADRMKIPMSKVFVNVDRVGNTSDASLPIALCEAHEQGLIKRGHIIVLAGMGPGCVLGATVLRWY